MQVHSIAHLVAWCKPDDSKRILDVLRLFGFDRDNAEAGAIGTVRETSAPVWSCSALVNDSEAYHIQPRARKETIMSDCFMGHAKTAIRLRWHVLT